MAIQFYYHHLTEKVFIYKISNTNDGIINSSPFS